MTPYRLSWTNPKLGKRRIASGSRGYGVVALARIRRGEVLSRFGGHVLTLGELRRLPSSLQQIAYQVGDGLYFGPVAKAGLTVSEHYNHSCNPNSGFDDSMTLVAMRAIRSGEEVTIDYAMCMSSYVLAMACSCGADGCRRLIRGSDWRKRELQRRYAGHFVPYLARKIERHAR